jgi:hypothetical protein
VTVRVGAFAYEMTTGWLSVVLMVLSLDEFAGNN